MSTDTPTTQVTAEVLGGPPATPADPPATFATKSWQPMDTRRDATVMELAQVIADSRAFPECRSPAAAAVRILAGREMGVGPITAVGGIRVQNGRVSMDAVLMAGCIRRSSRYDYAIHEHTQEQCRIEFMRDGVHLGFSEFGMADAKRAGLTKNDTWTKYPRNMIFARALSNGARWFCPDIFGGSVYTHEELGVPVDADGSAIDTAGAGADLCTRDQRQEIVRLAEATGKPLAKLLDELGVRMLDELSGYEADKLIRKLSKALAKAGGVAVQKPGPASEGPAPAGLAPAVQTLVEAAAEAALPSTPQQRQAIIDLAERLVPDERECRAMILGALERRNCRRIEQLTHLQAAALIEGLEKRLSEAAEEVPFAIQPASR